MYIGLNNLGLNTISSAFSPSNLFANGEQGYFYVNDLSTMYQDAAGTTPTVLEGGVGLWLDSKYGGVRGPELANAGYATPPGFDDVTTATSATSFSVVAGTTASRAYLTISAAPVSKTYEVTCRIVGVSVGSVGMYGRNSADSNGATIQNTANVGAGNTLRLIFTTSNTAASVLWVNTTIGANFSVDQISIREIPGNHATQPTTANRPTVSARYNKCTNNNANPVDLTGVSFTNATNGLASLSVVDDSAALTAAVTGGVIPAGKLTSGRVYKIDNSAGDTTAHASISGTVGDLNQHVFSACVRVEVLGAGVSVRRNTSNVVATAAGVGGYVRLSGTNTPTATTDFLAVSAGAGAVIYFILNDMRESIHAIPGIPTPQIVTGSGANYERAGYPIRVRWNGIDQWMQTQSVDFSGTDKMTVFAGVTKLSDAAASTILESGATIDTVAGTFQLSASGAAADALRRTWGLGLNGSASMFGSVGIYPAADSRVLTASFDIAGATNPDEQKLRINGASQTIIFAGAGPAGGGSFTAQPCYIGARNAGSSLFFNGDIFCLGARGATTTDATISKTEGYINSRMGKVY